jgi:hypothetical protein
MSQVVRAHGVLVSVYRQIPVPRVVAAVGPAADMALGSVLMGVTTSPTSSSR